MKICSKCKIKKDNFPKRRTSKDGFDHRCKDCHKIASKIYRNKPGSYQKRKAATDAWIERNLERTRKKQKEWALKNKEKVKQSSRKTYLKHKKERIKKVTDYAKKNPHKINARSAFYRALKIKATPKWLSKDQKEMLAKFYENCPKGMQVDHIVPLRGKTVCGLHVPWNLQYLTKEENCKKSNKLIEEIA